MKYSDAESRKRAGNRTALHQLIIDAIWQRYMNDLKKKRCKIPELQIELGAFAEKDETGKKFYAAYLEALQLQRPLSQFPVDYFLSVGPKTLRCALTRDKSDFGAIPEMRDFLCAYAFKGKNWLQTLEYLEKQGHMGMSEQDQYDEHARLKAMLVAEKSQAHLSKVEEYAGSRFSQSWCERLKRFPEEFDWEITPLDGYDLEALKKDDLLKNTFGDIRWDLIEQRLSMNADIMKGIRFSTDDIIPGFYIIYPITDRCRTLVEQGAIQKSDEFELKHLTKDYKSASAIYISFVYALEQSFSRPNLYKEFKRDLIGKLSNGSKIERVFTRPTTNEGKRLVEKYRFQPLENSKICSLKPQEFLPRLK